MSTIGKSGVPQTRRYSPEEKQRPVRMVRQLRRANDLLKRASAFFAAALDRPSR